jgi:hypothetical protein
MGKNDRRNFNAGAKKKFGEYLIDISKYVITVVMITLFFNDISSSKLLTYIIGSLVAVLTLLWGLFYFKRKN